MKPRVRSGLQLIRLGSSDGYEGGVGKGVVASTPTLCCQSPEERYDRSLEWAGWWVGGWEEKEVGWGATNRLIHSSSASLAFLSTLRCTFSRGTWWYKVEWSAGQQSRVVRMPADGATVTQSMVLSPANQPARRGGRRLSRGCARRRVLALSVRCAPGVPLGHNGGPRRRAGTRTSATD